MEDGGLGEKVLTQGAPAQKPDTWVQQALGQSAPSPSQNKTTAGREPEGSPCQGLVVYVHSMCSTQSANLTSLCVYVCLAGALALTFAVDPRRLKYSLLTSSTDVVHALLGSEQYSPASSCSNASSTHDQAAVITASPGGSTTLIAGVCCVILQSDNGIEHRPVHAHSCSKIGMHTPAARVEPSVRPSM
jgi:hypothetical protein